MRYRDRDGKRYLESTNTEEWQAAQQKLHERLQARDQNTLQTIRRGEQLLFNRWVYFPGELLPASYSGGNDPSRKYHGAEALETRIR